jgi:hypothetical protein
MLFMKPTLDSLRFATRATEASRTSARTSRSVCLLRPFVVGSTNEEVLERLAGPWVPLLQLAKFAPVEVDERRALLYGALPPGSPAMAVKLTVTFNDSHITELFQEVGPYSRS